MAVLAQRNSRWVVLGACATLFVAACLLIVSKGNGVSSSAELLANNSSQYWSRSYGDALTASAGSSSHLDSVHQVIGGLADKWDQQNTGDTEPFAFCDHSTDLTFIQVQECLVHYVRGMDLPWSKVMHRNISLSRLEAEDEAVNKSASAVVFPACALIHSVEGAAAECLNLVQAEMVGLKARACIRAMTPEQHQKCAHVTEAWNRVASLIGSQRLMSEEEMRKRQEDAAAAVAAEEARKTREGAQEKANDGSSDALSPKLQAWLAIEKELTVNGSRMLDKMDSDLAKSTSASILNITALLGPGLTLPHIDNEAALEKGILDADNASSSSESGNSLAHDWSKQFDHHQPPPAGLLARKQSLWMTRLHTESDQQLSVSQATKDMAFTDAAIHLEQLKMRASIAAARHDVQVIQKDMALASEGLAGPATTARTRAAVQGHPQQAVAPQQHPMLVHQGVTSDLSRMSRKLRQGIHGADAMDVDSDETQRVLKHSVASSSVSLPATTTLAGTSASKVQVKVSSMQAQAAHGLNEARGLQEMDRKYGSNLGGLLSFLQGSGGGLGEKSQAVNSPIGDKATTQEWPQTVVPAAGSMPAVAPDTHVAKDVATEAVADASSIQHVSSSQSVPQAAPPKVLAMDKPVPNSDGGMSMVAGSKEAVAASKGVVLEGGVLKVAAGTAPSTSTASHIIPASNGASDAIHVRESDQQDAMQAASSTGRAMSVNSNSVVSGEDAMDAVRATDAKIRQVESSMRDALKKEHIAQAEARASQAAMERAESGGGGLAEIAEVLGEAGAAGRDMLGKVMDGIVSPQNSIKGTKAGQIRR